MRRPLLKKSICGDELIRHEELREQLGIVVEYQRRQRHLWENGVKIAKDDEHVTHSFFSNAVAEEIKKFNSYRQIRASSRAIHAVENIFER